MIDPGRNIRIMGIVNLTDDSFFAESRCADVFSALERVRTMLAEGADIIDVGACSTRPGTQMVGAEQEWKRLGPFLTAFKDTFPNVELSVDTCWSSVVRNAYNLIGEFTVNDISAGKADMAMLQTVGKLGLEYIAMHMRGTPENMQELTDYKSVTDALISFFSEFTKQAAEYGIEKWTLDPGFGFAKTIDQNYSLLRDLGRFRELRRADGSAPSILVGISRKSMIYKKFAISPEDSLPATQVLHLYAMQNGADILRVHDVAEAVRTRELYRLLFR